MSTCIDIENENDENRCKHLAQKFNQCCQDCTELKSCKEHCDYAHDFDCIAKNAIDC